MAAEQRLNRGFTLLEVVVALAILALSLGVLMQIFGSAARRADLAASYSTALLLAESQMALLAQGQSSSAWTSGGDYGEKYRWRGLVEPYSGGDQMFSPLVPRLLTVEVVWPGEGSERTVRLQTVRLLPER